MNSVVCAGEILIDMISVQTGCTLEESDSFYKQAGGAPANVTCAISNLGGKSYFLGAAGDDPFGAFLVNTLKKFGVNVDYLELVKKYPTTLAFVSLMADGERDFIFNRGADSEYVFDNNLTNAEPIGIMHFGSATAFLGGALENSYDDLLKYALENEIFISFDPNWRNAFWSHKKEEFIKKSMKYLAKAHLIKLSDEELRIISGKSDVKSGLKKMFDICPATYCITLGKEGTYVYSENFDQIVPSIKVDPVDTTGAGDAFIGALLYQLSTSDMPHELLKDSRFLEIVSFANMVGALVTTRHGALSALPTQEEVKKLIK